MAHFLRYSGQGLARISQKIVAKNREVLPIQANVDFGEVDAVLTGFGVYAYPKSTLICEKCRSGLIS